MKWILISLALLLACAAPTGDDGLEPGQAHLTIINGLELDIVSIAFWWSDDSRTYSDLTFEPGDSKVFIVECDTYGMRCIDEDGRIYSRYDVEITEEGYTWEVTQADYGE